MSTVIETLSNSTSNDTFNKNIDPTQAIWQESEFNSFDGLTLFYRFREPNNDYNKTLLFLHRGHEHSGRIMSIAESLAQQEYWCFSFDLRGHGRSRGTRAWAPNFESWVKDLNCFIGHIHKVYGITTNDTILVANSIGSVMAVNWILNYGSNLRGCILGAPAFSIKLYIPLALPFLKLLSKVTKHQFVTSYVRSSLLTRDKKQAEAYDADPLITKKIGVNLLVTLFDAYKRCFKRLEDFEVPVLLFTAKNDFIVHNKTHIAFINKIASKNKKHIILQDFRHAIFHEQQQYKIIDPCNRFIEALFNNSKIQLPAVIPEARQHTVLEYQKLVAQGSTVKQLYYASYRYLFKKIGSLSDGVSVGLKHGFDSGISLDYIYLNKASGRNRLGRIIDNVYLNSVGWKGIRTRKKHLKNSLIAITQLLNERGVEPVIFDIASGPGRYLFELQSEAQFSIRLYLNDLDINAVNYAKQLTNDFNANSTVLMNQNVFDTIKPENFKTAPNIIIISGLFELYENNNHVHKVISNMYSLLADGGYIVYTGQPWHPQIELIARLLNNRNGQRWIMRRRIQSELDQLIESSGFEKLSTESDDLGIFTVSCAQKVY